MVVSFDIETARKSAETYRAAKLALLRIQAHNTIERTDASTRKVEEALERLAHAQIESNIGG